MKPRNAFLAMALVLLCSCVVLAQPKKLADIEGIGPAYEKKLGDAGIKNPAQLYEAAAQRKGREELAQKSGISATLLLKWVNRYDLARVKGIGTQYADLLEAAGVDSPKELARRNADNLLETLTKVNGEKNLVRKLPTKAQIGEWIKTAKKTSTKVEG